MGQNRYMILWGHATGCNDEKTSWEYDKPQKQDHKQISLGKHLAYIALDTEIKDKRFDEMCPISLKSFSKHDDDGDKNLKNCIFNYKKDSGFARFARGFLIFEHFADVHVLSTTSSDLYSWRWYSFFFSFSTPNRSYKFKFRIAITHLGGQMTWNNPEWLQKDKLQ